MILKERVQFLNQQPIQKRQYVLYWMQASQRAEYNHALEAAILKANELNKPLLVIFGITDNFPEANERHYRFMLEGLRETQRVLKNRNIRMLILHESPERAALKVASQADLVITDCGYLRIQRDWRIYVAERVDCLMVQVESDVVVPVQVASQKENYSAATFRPRINQRLEYFLKPLDSYHIKVASLNQPLDFEEFDISNVDTALEKLSIDRNVHRTDLFKGGTSQAKIYLDNFWNLKFKDYAELRNDPSLDYCSNMSPYLHFGQISPLYIALKALEADQPGVDKFFDELIIRRELSMNFVFFNSSYDHYECLPDWARATLAEHQFDPRQYNYSLEEFEQAKTHDPYWNAAQMEMVLTGKMQGYMRMYWGKKILEWSSTPESAFKTALYLNNKYELDGRDSNGFAGVAWCFGKHDRAWPERPVFGKIRYMNAGGLERKFDIKKYVQKIDSLNDKLS
ncbi:deoxyribodipyrimidine photo-lyase [candidate division KSB1 bacterium]|nr:deoxyribodipyrimidine photo-lyase [candidate division KSB1 bacterium]